MRRSNAWAPAVLSFGGVELDCGRYILRADGGETRLNNKEYQLMELFMRHPRQVFSTARLMEKVWELDSESDMDCGVDLYRLPAAQAAAAGRGR